MIRLYNEFCKSYIGLTKENSDGFIETVEDILFSEEIQSMSEFEQHLEIDRLQHITSVAYIAYLISKQQGLNYRSCARAAVMHDLVYYDWRNGVTGKWHRLHGYRHPNLACMNAKELCNGSLSKLEDSIIRRHMWPLTVIPPENREGWIVTFADKYCAALEVLYSTNDKFKAKFLKDIGR